VLEAPPAIAETSADAEGYAGAAASQPTNAEESRIELIESHAEDGSEGDLEPEDLEGFLDTCASGSFPTSAEEMTIRTTAMLNESGKLAVPCDLSLIRSPDDFAPLSRDSPGIRSGLYVGDYGHSFYGQYRTEVLLLEYKALSKHELASEIEAPMQIFARPGGQQAPPELQCLQHLEGPVTFMRGVKQCGDIHVPMGATTFVAVCGPPEACVALAAGHTVPGALLNRTTNKLEAIAHSWRGFGTLAAPGFGTPSWASGWLVQFADADTNGGHRFGFAWDRNQDVVVLQWIDAQDACPFLQRTWLPEDLQ